MAAPLGPLNIVSFAWFFYLLQACLQAFHILVSVLCAD